MQTFGQKYVQLWGFDFPWRLPDLLLIVSLRLAISLKFSISEVPLLSLLLCLKRDRIERRSENCVCLVLGIPPMKDKEWRNSFILFYFTFTKFDDSSNFFYCKSVHFWKFPWQMYPIELRMAFRKKGISGLHQHFWLNIDGVVPDNLFWGYGMSQHQPSLTNMCWEWKREENILGPTFH